MKERKVLLILALLYAVVQGAWAWEGDGTSANPYQISSIDDWNALANSVNNGTSTYSGVYFKLTKDFYDPVSTMVGNKDHAFQGFFYGNGKTLKVSYVTETKFTAPFRYINSATISGLTVDGIIQSTAKYAGGLVANAKGSNVISGCRISVALNSELSGDGTHGGVVAYIESGGIAAQPILNSQSSTLNSESWYSLDGRKLHGVGEGPVPTRLHKGIYIHNGKKVVVK